MAYTIQATWDTSSTGLTCVLDEQGTANTSVTVSVTNLCHTAIPSSNTGVAYSKFATVFASALDSASPSGWTYTVDLTTTGSQAYYTVASTGNSFKLTFSGSGDPGTHMQNVLGYDGDIGSYGSSHQGFWIPYYLILPVHGGPSRSSGDYEPEDIAEDEEADDGTPTAIIRTQVPTYHDWFQLLEPIASVYKRKTSSSLGQGKAVAWTYQHFWEHVRADRPFLTVDFGGSGETTVHTMRAKAASFRPERNVDNYDEYWDLEFRTRIRGARL